MTPKSSILLNDRQKKGARIQNSEYKININSKSYSYYLSDFVVFFEKLNKWKRNDY